MQKGMGVRQLKFVLAMRGQFLCAAKLPIMAAQVSSTNRAILNVMILVAIFHKL